MATNPPITIGELVDVPAPGSGVKSAWCQEVTNRVVQRFATVVDRDARWPAATVGRGAQCVTLDTDTQWRVTGSPPIWTRYPSSEIVHSEITATVSVTATTAATAVNVVNAGNVTYDGSPIIVEFFAASIAPPNVVNGQLAVSLWDVNTDMGTLVMVYNASGSAFQCPALGRRRITPTPGLHNYNLRAWISPSGTGSVVAGVGAPAYPPAFLRITRA